MYECNHLILEVVPFGSKLLKSCRRQLIGFYKMSFLVLLQKLKQWDKHSQSLWSVLSTTWCITFGAAKGFHNEGLG